MTHFLLWTPTQYYTQIIQGVAEIVGKLILLLARLSDVFRITGHKVLPFILALILLLHVGLNHLTISSSHHQGRFTIGCIQSLG